MKNVLRVCLAAAISYAILSIATPQPNPAQKTLRESVYTADQATQGAQIYATRCATCHGDNLQGMESAPSLAGANFKKSWETQPLATLANRIRTTMPPTAPNSITGPQLNNLMSYILKANDIAAGTVALSLPGTGPAPTTTSTAPANTNWTTYGADLASTRYAPLDQINKENFSKLQVAWRLNTNNLGSTADRLYSSTPLVVDGVMYVTAGMARTVVAMNPGTGQMLWIYQMDEGERGVFAPRRGAGRGLSYWQSAKY